jgi:hypothetical protein
MPDNDKIQLPKGFKLDESVETPNVKLPKGFTLDTEVVKKKVGGEESSLTKSPSISQEYLREGQGLADKGFIKTEKLDPSQLVSQYRSPDISLTPKPKKNYYSDKLEKGLIFDKEGKLYEPSSEALTKAITPAQQIDLKKPTEKDLVEKSREMPVVDEPVEKQGLLLNTVSALDKAFAKGFSSPVRALGTALQGATKKVMGGTGEGFVSDALIKFGDYLNNAIDELTPQDEEFKGTLIDQVAQAFGQVGSLVLTGGLTGAAGKGAALISQVPKAGTVMTAAKTLSSQLASPTAISAGLSMGQAEFDRAKEAGATDDQAFEAFYKNAVTGSVLETIPVMQFFKRFNNSTGGSVANYIKTKGVAGLTGGIEEMTTEVLQQIYSNKTAKDIYNINQEILDGVGTSGGIGFGVGFLLNAMGANAKILRKQGKVKEADALDNQVKQYEDNLENPKVTSGNKVAAKDIVTQGVEVGTQKAVKNLDRDLANNVITPEQYQEGIVFAEKAAQVADKIPETVTGESRAKSIELLVERNDINQANQNLLQQKQTTDVAYHAGIDQEIKTNEERIKKIDAEVYNIAKKPSKEFGGKKYIVDGEEVSQAEFEALQGKPVGTKEIIKAEVKPTEVEVTEEVKPTEVKVGPKPKANTEEGIKESNKWVNDLFDNNNGAIIKDNNGNYYKIQGTKLKKIILDKDKNIIDSETVYLDYRYKKGTYSHPDFFQTGYEVVSEIKPTEVKPSEEKEDIYFNKLQKSEKFDDNSSVSTYLGDDKGEKNIFYTLPNKGIISFKEIKNNTNRFSLTANAKNDKPLDIKNAFKRIEKFLPANHELIEDKSISVDGLRVWNNFIKNDKYIKTGETKEVEITPIDKTNLFKDLKYNTEGKWNGAKFENKDEALARLEKYLKNNNLNFKVKIDGDFIKVEVPVLKNNPSKEVQPTEVKEEVKTIEQADRIPAKYKTINIDEEIAKNNEIIKKGNTLDKSFAKRANNDLLKAKALGKKEYQSTEKPPKGYNLTTIGNKEYYTKQKELKPKVKEEGKAAKVAQPELAPVEEGRTPQVKPLSKFKVGDKFVFATDRDGTERTIVSIDNGIVTFKSKGSKETSSASEIQRLGNDLALLKSDWDKGIRPNESEFKGSRFKSKTKPTKEQINNLTKELLRVNYRGDDLTVKTQGKPGTEGYVESAEDSYREIAKSYLENDIDIVEVVDDLHGGKERLQKIINGETPKKTYQEAVKEKLEADKKRNREAGAERAIVTKEIYRRVDQMDAPVDAEQVALRYLADGGTVSKEAVDEAYGSVKRAELNVKRRVSLSEEVKSKDFVKGNETLDDLAHRLWEANNQKIPEDKIKDKLMAEIGNNNTRLEAAEAYLDKYNAEYKLEKEEMRMAELYKEQYLEEQAEIEKELRKPLDEQIEGEASEEHINNLIKQYEAEIKGEDQQLRPEGQAKVDRETSKGKVAEKNETELAKEYKEVIGKASKKAKENAKKDFVDRNFDNIVEKLKIQIKCPT